MTTWSGDDVRRGRVVLDGFERDRERLRLAIHALDDKGNTIDSVAVDEEGAFRVDTRLLERATKFMIGPADAKPDVRRMFYMLPASELKKTLLADAELAIAGKIWHGWLSVRRCVSGNVRRCFPFLNVIDDLSLIHI